MTLGLQTLGSVSNTPAAAACLQAERLLRGAFVPSAAGSLHLPLKLDFKNFCEQSHGFTRTPGWTPCGKRKTKSLQGLAKHSALF